MRNQVRNLDVSETNKRGRYGGKEGQIESMPRRLGIAYEDRNHLRPFFWFARTKRTGAFDL